jgi:hypothetical protein
VFHVERASAIPREEGSWFLAGRTGFVEEGSFRRNVFHVERARGCFALAIRGDGVLTRMEALPAG